MVSCREEDTVMLQTVEGWRGGGGGDETAAIRGSSARDASDEACRQVEYRKPRSVAALVDQQRRLWRRPSRLGGGRLWRRAAWRRKGADPSGVRRQGWGYRDQTASPSCATWLGGSGTRPGENTKYGWRTCKFIDLLSL